MLLINHSTNNTVSAPYLSPPMPSRDILPFHDTRQGRDIIMYNESLEVRRTLPQSTKPAKSQPLARYAENQSSMNDLLTMRKRRL
jgi:hypothetical protein